MRIGVDIRALAEPRSTGVPMYLRGLVDAFVRGPFSHEFVLFSSGWTTKTRVAIPEGAHVTRRHLDIPNKILSASFYTLGLPRLDRMLGVEAMFFPNMHFMAVSTAAQVVMTVHDLSFWHMPSSYSLRGRWWHRAIRPSALFRRADALIAVSQSTKQDLVDTFGVDEKKVYVVYPGTPTLRAVGEGERLETLKHFGIDLPFVLALGPLDPRKNLSVAVEAFRRLPRSVGSAYQLVIAGSHSWKLDRPGMDLMRSGGHVRNLGFVSEKEKSVLLRSARCLMYPSRYEGFGFPIVEAMSVGTPVITSTSSSMPEVVGDAGLTANPDDPSEFSAALNDVLVDDRLHALLAERSLQRSRIFTWDRAARECVSILAGEQPL